MKFAFLIMGNFNSKIDHASIHNGMAQMIGVANIQEASMVAKKLYEDGIDCIELCGAFTVHDTRKIIEATKHKIPVGYSIHLPEQDELFTSTFSK